MQQMVPSGQCRHHSTDSLPSSQSSHMLGSLLNGWDVHGNQWHRAVGMWGWRWTLLPASLASVMAPLQFVSVKNLAFRQQPVFSEL